MIAWPSNVNQRILRNGSEWEEVEGFIEDETLAGKKKRRLDTTQKKRRFSVKMRFNKVEYAYFRSWWANSCLYGLNSFEFPKIDGSGNGEYRFVKGGAPKYSNPAGEWVAAAMVWEEI